MWTQCIHSNGFKIVVIDNTMATAAVIAAEKWAEYGCHDGNSPFFVLLTNTYVKVFKVQIKSGQITSAFCEAHLNLSYILSGLNEFGQCKSDYI